MVCWTLPVPARLPRPGQWTIKVLGILILCTSTSMLSFYIHITNVDHKNSISNKNLGISFLLHSGTHPIDDRTALRTILRRTKLSQSDCSSTGQNNQHHRQLNETELSLPSLPEVGVANAITEWLHSSKNSKSQCTLPPSKSCKTSTFTIVLMSHNTGRFRKLMDAINDLFLQWIDVGLTEIIFVWNAPRTALKGRNTTASNSTEYVTQMLQWDADENHPFRIFYAFENGLTNNLLNRYHPLIAPRNEAVVYFDDDGPFFTTNRELMRSGIELWRTNADIQVGTYGRYLTFSSERINDKGQASDGHIYNNFVPICGHNMKYNRDTFSDFGATVILPTRSIIHRNFFCFIWHPAFEELRQFILDHPTHPDDMFVSVLIGQLSGRGAKLYPRLEWNGTRPKVKGSIDKHLPDFNHRRLLWELPHWFDHREAAINSILRYFGTIHPGSTGWCDGTPYMKANKLYPSNSSIPYVCEPTFPSVGIIPWMNENHY